MCACLRLKRFFRRKSNKPAQVYYLLPLKWSLHYIMKDREWKDFRERVKQVTPEWEHCTCPKHCKATSLDEQWAYDDETHTKRFLNATFICPGCHWLKSKPWRIDTWLRIIEGKMPPATKPPHIIDCLGWTQEQVDELRRKDLADHKREIAQLQEIDREVHAGKAEIRFWRVDLSALSQYGYSQEQIADYERRMYKLAEDRLASMPSVG